MKMRSQYIPEEARSTIMNFFRIPLNLFVCVVLYNVSNQKNLRETPISRFMFFFLKKILTMKELKDFINLFS